MNFEMSTLNPESNTSPYIRYGSNQVLHLNDIELKYSANTGSPKAILHVETKPVDTKGFVPAQGSNGGRIGKVACGVYMKEDSAKKEFLRRLLNIAIALGVEEEVSEVKSDSFESVVKRITDILTRKDLYARYTIFAEEYPKQGGKGVTLFFPRTNFVESLDTDPTTLVQFDKNNAYHYKKLPEVERESFKDEPKVDDGLPF